MATETSYRKINLEFLNQSGDEHFDIYYKTRSYGTVKYVRFASSKPEHHEKVLRLLESGDPLEDFFIQEEDLFKYYRHATTTLRKIVANPKISFTKKAQKVYDVSKSIMKEFFENNASEKVLRSSDEVMEIMEECFQDYDIGFYGISKITNKDYYTYTHSVNVGLYCMTYGVKINMNHDEIRTLGLGGMLHDVGKSKISNTILNKKGLLTPNEFQIVKNHAPLGGQILEEMNCYAGAVIDMANQHHEKYKGGGYPLGIVGEEISYFARICKVMDVYDALTTRRSYKKAMSPFDTLTLMKKQMVDEFDSQILDNFIRYMGPEM
ncbi:MAG: HD domain-containing protein [Nitrospinaceae bacterium]|nr:HD-GYP domain-containing protein [Nitrospinaceae bacterium]NIR57711.1 HD-GYP domain-containing protein [Nitrospinaceae bacterium]NIS88175.1 HD-GYP domain-containing protein [Nitrospinaceae bacterium]NIT85053.1 HD-GYP domain-containing protein [Nitrospinaceae bacterium]NIU47215.1 HD-GYP domain-containing protein [Nitrospinaceae bacterium]